MWAAKGTCELTHEVGPRRMGQGQSRTCPWCAGMETVPECRCRDTGSWELSLWLGEDIKKDCMGKASHWGAKFPNDGRQACQQAVMFKCQLCHDRANPLQHCPTTIHSSEPPLCTVSEGRYQKNVKQRNANIFKSLKCFLKLFGCQHSHL